MKPEESVKVYSYRGTLGFTATTLLFLSLVYTPVSIVGLFSSLSLLILLAVSNGAGFRRLYESLWTPFLPFALVMTGAALFQETLSEASHFLTVGIVYAVARLIRLALRLEWILAATAIVGASMSVIWQLSLSPVGDLVPLIRKLAEIHMRNPAGTALSFGLVALLGLSWFLTNSKWGRFFWSLAMAFSVLLLAFSDVMTGIIGAALTVAALGLLLGAVRSGSNSNNWVLGQSPWKFLVGLPVVGFIGLALWNLNLFAPLSGESIFLRRDFTHLTGRTEIWRCYLENISVAPADRWSSTLECVGSVHANLHNSFLQSHLTAGAMGLLAISFAFIFSIYLLLRGIRGVAVAETTLREKFSWFSILVLGLVFSTTESYLLVYLYPTLLVFAAAPEWRLRFKAQV